MKEPNDDDIRQRAYFIWDQAGRPHGMASDHWLQAKWELTNEAAAVGNGATATPKARGRKATAPRSGAAKPKKATKATKARSAATSDLATPKGRAKSK